MTQSKERRLKEKLDLREFKLNALLKVTEAIMRSLRVLTWRSMWTR